MMFRIGKPTRRLAICAALAVSTMASSLHQDRSYAQTVRPTVKLIHIAEATIDDGKHGFTDKTFTGAIVEVDFSAAAGPLDIDATALNSPGTMSVPAFAYLPRHLDNAIALTPSAPFAILSLGGAVAITRANSPDIQFSGWDVMIGNEKVASWGSGSIPAIRSGKSGLKVKASRPGKATLAIIFETPRANVDSIRILDTTLASKEGAPRR